MSHDPPRTVPLRTRVLVYLDFLWIPFLWLAVFLPWTASDYAESGLLTAFRECVDVPAQVVRTRSVSESHGKHNWWHGHRVWATFSYGGESLYAIGDMAQVPADGRVMARVPIHRPDLAVAFTGERPHVNTTWFMSALVSVMGVVGLVLLAFTAYRFDRRLARGHVVRARALRHQNGKSTTYFRITYPSAEGRVETNLTLLHAAAKRVLADPQHFARERRGHVHVWPSDAAPELHVMYDAAKVTDARAFVDVFGVRWDEVRGEIVPAPWRRLVWRALPAACFVAGCVSALLRSYLLPPALDASLRTLGGLWP